MGKLVISRIVDCIFQNWLRPAFYYLYFFYFGRLEFHCDSIAIWEIIGKGFRSMIHKWIATDRWSISSGSFLRSPSFPDICRRHRPFSVLSARVPHTPALLPATEAAAYSLHCRGTGALRLCFYSLFAASIVTIYL